MAGQIPDEFPFDARLERGVQVGAQIAGRFGRRHDDDAQARILACCALQGRGNGVHGARYSRVPFSRAISRFNTATSARSFSIRSMSWLTIDISPGPRSSGSG